MSDTTSHIETKLSERIRAVASEYNIPLSRDIMVGDDILEQFATDAHALESRIEALSRQPVQTEDLEAVEQHAIEWWSSESTRQLFPDPVPNPIGMATDFYRFMQARSLSEPKSQGFTPTNTSDNG